MYNKRVNSFVSLANVHGTGNILLGWEYGSEVDDVGRFLFLVEYNQAYGHI
jgi:hypothetical protein